MADNMGVTPGAGVTIRLDEIGGKLYQCIKLALGVDGTFQKFLEAGVLSKANSLSMCLASDQALTLYSEDVTSVPLATRTENGNSDDINVGSYKEAMFFINCKAANAGTTLEVTIKTKDPLVGEYEELERFDPIYSIGKQLISLQNCIGSTIRIEWELSGDSPSARFGVGIVLKS